MGATSIILKFLHEKPFTTKEIEYKLKIDIDQINFISLENFYNYLMFLKKGLQN